MKKGKKKTQTKTKPKEEEKKEKEPEPESNVYTEEEVKRLDEFHAQTENKFDDDEIYELMLKYKDNDEEILRELQEQLKERKRGEEYEWREVGKSN
jgi:flagellar basal body-associated protein FliL